MGDSLATLLNAGGQTVADVGYDKVYKLVQQAKDYHEQQVFGELVPTFCYVTQNQEEPYSVLNVKTVQKFDEFGRPPVQKTGGVAFLGFPMDHVGDSVGWTMDYYRKTPAKEFADQLIASFDGDLNGIRVAIVSAMLNPTNNLTYIDRLWNKRRLSLRAFLNADGEQVQPGPQQQPFDPTTHTHYNGVTTLTGPAVTALITNVLEHGNVGELDIYIGLGLEATIRTFTGANEFRAFQDIRIHQAITTEYAVSQSLDIYNPGNRAIGIFGAATVWVKPWMPANYVMCVDRGNGSMKPLGWRQNPGGIDSDFGLHGNSRTDAFPLAAETLWRDYGISVYQRHMGAALYIGGSSYVAPTING